jgi:hypothetical protein
MVQVDSMQQMQTSLAGMARLPSASAGEPVLPPLPSLDQPPTYHMVMQNSEPEVRSASHVSGCGNRRWDISLLPAARFSLRSFFWPS